MSTPPWGGEQPPPPPPPNPYGPQGAPYQPYGTGPSPYDGGPYPPGAPGYPAPPRTNGLAVASLCVGIGSIVLCLGFTGIAGALMGHAARKQIRNDPTQTGEGLAVGGIVVGWVAFALAIVGTLLFVGLIVLGLAVGSSVDDCHTDTDGYTTCS